MSSIKPSKKPSDIGTLVRVLSKQYDALVSANSDQTLISNYFALIQFLQSATKDEKERIFSTHNPRTIKRSRSDSQYHDSDIAQLSIGELEKIINDKNTPRTLLERIAIQRFRVPRGSMRSFSNRRMLVDKLSTLIRNEQAHAIIDNVARGQIARASKLSED